jgi:hypothetical protein
LIQAGIHSGEIDGKDAGFALLRDIAITKSRAGLLKDCILLFVPVYNVDGTKWRRRIIASTKTVQTKWAGAQRAPD